MWALLRTRRWIAFTLLVVVVIVAFGLLSRWQWSRADERRFERLQLLEQSQAMPVTWQAAMAQPHEWSPVTVTGTYDGAATVLVRQRPLNGSNGFWVATPLSEADGGTVWINRGWVAASGAATQQQSAPPPPAGTVTVTGRLRVTETVPQPVPQDLPVGQVPALDTSFLVGPGTSYDAYYLEAVSSIPADPEVTVLPAPEVDEGRNISYAVQWILFALVAIVGWFFFLRREARDDARAVETGSSANATKGGPRDGPGTA